MISHCFCEIVIKHFAWFDRLTAHGLGNGKEIIESFISLMKWFGLLRLFVRSLMQAWLCLLCGFTRQSMRCMTERVNGTISKEHRRRQPHMYTRTRTLIDNLDKKAYMFISDFILSRSNLHQSELHHYFIITYWGVFVVKLFAFDVD